jgi:hypothetical protein
MLVIPPVSDGLRVLGARYNHRNFAFSKIRGIHFLEVIESPPVVEVRPPISERKPGTRSSRTENQCRFHRYKSLYPGWAYSALVHHTEALKAPSCNIG